MKNSKEMADAVFRIRDAYAEKKNKRKLIIKRTALVCSTACMFGLIFGAIKLSAPKKPHPVDSGIIVETETSSADSTAAQTSPSTTAPTSLNSTALSSQSTSAAQTTSTQATSTEADETTASTRQTSSTVSTTTASAHTTKTTATTTQTRVSVHEETEPKTVTTTTTAAVTVSPALTVTTQFVMTQVVATVAPETAAVSSAGSVTTATSSVEVVETMPVTTVPLHERYPSFTENGRKYEDTGKTVPIKDVNTMLKKIEITSTDGKETRTAILYAVNDNIMPTKNVYAVCFGGGTGYWLYAAEKE